MSKGRSDGDLSGLTEPKKKKRGERNIRRKTGNPGKKGGVFPDECTKMEKNW